MFGLVKKLRARHRRLRMATMRIERVGLRRAYLNDMYHLMISASWTELFLINCLLFALSNVAFAVAYLYGGDCISGAEPGSFADAFFFSIQTMATVGYGHMSPQGMYANVLASAEAFFGLIGTALGTGMVFSKFAVPTARILFSHVAVIGPHDGGPALMFRMANERGNTLVHSRISVSLAMDEATSEGHTVRRFYNLNLTRGVLPVFAYAWTAIHPIKEESPLYQITAADLIRRRARVFVDITAIEEDLVQTVHARYTYRPSNLVWRARFVDIIDRTSDDLLRVDYTRFHDVERIATHEALCSMEQITPAEWELEEGTPDPVDE